MRVVPVAEHLGLIIAPFDVLFAVFQQLFRGFIFIVARIEQAGDGGGGNRGTWPPGISQTVLNASVGSHAFANVFDRFIDDFLWNRNSRISTSAKPLHLSHAS